jgi:hypothetical protein
MRLALVRSGPPRRRYIVRLRNFSEELVPRISPALQELVGGRTTEVLPALENILLEGF